jgi:hypothetical protein
MVCNPQATSQSWKKKKKKKERERKKSPTIHIGPIQIFQVHKVRTSAREKTIGPNLNAHESADCSILVLRKVQIAESASLVRRTTVRSASARSRVWSRVWNPSRNRRVTKLNCSEFTDPPESLPQETTTYI